MNSDLQIPYAGPSLNKHEINKPVIEKELLPIHWAIIQFQPYIILLFTHKNPSSSLTRIRLDLMDYDFKIICKQGKINTNVDALSRTKIYQ